MRNRDDTVGGFVIRAATIVDAAMLAALGARTFAQAYAHANTADDMRAHLLRTFSETLQAEELIDPNLRTWLVEPTGHDRDETIRNASEAFGYARVRRGSGAPCVRFSAPVELEAIYVDASRQGGGAGAALVDAAVEQAKYWGCDGIWLGVWEHNPRAIAFYERMGFTMAGSIPFELGSDLQTDLVMTRSL
ncbi:MAG: GNAT family N-acetyltransferase [Gemmatimonadaceae bacterium]